MKTIFPIVAKDFLKLIVGLLVSVAIVVAIHYGTDGTNSAEGSADPAQVEAPASEASVDDAPAESAPADTVPAASSAE